MRNIVISIIIFLILTLSSCKNSNVIKSSSPNKWVLAENGLNLREAPDIQSKSLAVIPYGEKLFYIEKDDKIVVINYLKGNWIKVKYNNIIGWAFDSYLDETPPSKFKCFPPDKREKRYGNFIILGCKEYWSELYNGRYTSLFYKGEKIADIEYDIGLQLLDDNAGIFMKMEKVIEKYGSVNENYVTIDTYYLYANNKLRRLDTLSKISSSKAKVTWFSSPSVINNKIYLWGFSKENTYAICYNYRDNKIIETKLSSSPRVGTCNFQIYKRPYLKDNYIHYDLPFGNVHRIIADCKLIK